MRHIRRPLKVFRAPVPWSIGNRTSGGEIEREDEADEKGETKRAKAEEEEDREDGGEAGPDTHKDRSTTPKIVPRRPKMLPRRPKRLRRGFP